MKLIGNTQFFSVSEAKAILPKIVEGLQTATVLLRRSEPVAALVSIEQYNDYLALEKLVQHPDLYDQIRSQADEARKVPIEQLGTLDDLQAAYERMAAPVPAPSVPQR
jgi:hypothetical protein